MGEPYHAFWLKHAETGVVRDGARADNNPMLLRAFDDAVMPLRCVFCGTRTRPPEWCICEGCDTDLPRIESPPPPVSSPLAFDVAPLAYEFPVDAALKAFKFRRKLFYAPAFAELLCVACEHLPQDIDAVLPVPLHWRRKWFRGFNQALEIAKPVAKHLSAPIVTTVRRKRATPFQSGLSAGARARNLRSAFVVRGKLRFRHVLVIDDVTTTGTTIRELARVLRRAGARRVSALAIARSG